MDMKDGVMVIGYQAQSNSVMTCQLSVFALVGSFADGLDPHTKDQEEYMA